MKEIFEKVKALDITNACAVMVTVDSNAFARGFIDIDRLVSYVKHATGDKSLPVFVVSSDLDITAIDPAYMAEKGWVKSDYLAKATRALVGNGFTLVDGAQEWRPPLGPSAKPWLDKIDRLECVQASLLSALESLVLFTKPTKTNAVALNNAHVLINELKAAGK